MSYLWFFCTQSDIHIYIYRYVYLRRNASIRKTDNNDDAHQPTGSTTRRSHYPSSLKMRSSKLLCLSCGLLSINIPTNAFDKMGELPRMRNQYGAETACQLLADVGRLHNYMLWQQSQHCIASHWEGLDLSICLRTRWGQGRSNQALYSETLQRMERVYRAHQSRFYGSQKLRCPTTTSRSALASAPDFLDLCISQSACCSG